MNSITKFVILFSFIIVAVQSIPVSSSGEDAEDLTAYGAVPTDLSPEATGYLSFGLGGSPYGYGGIGIGRYGGNYYGGGLGNYGGGLGHYGYGNNYYGNYGRGIYGY